MKHTISDYLSRFFALLRLFLIKQEIEISNGKVRVYFACALRNATPEYIENVRDLKKLLSRNPKVELLSFFGNEGNSDQKIYHHDIHHCVENADIIFADYAFPDSDGRGWELGKAIEKRRIPVVAMVPSGVEISRLVLGAKHFRNPTFHLEAYQDFSEIPKIVEEKIEEIFFS